MKHENALGWALSRIARMRGVPLDELRLQHALGELEGQDDADVSLADMQRVTKLLGWPPPATLDAPDRAHLPLLVQTDCEGWGVLVDAAPGGGWTFEQEGALLELGPDAALLQIIRLGTPSAAQTSDQGSFALRLHHAFRAYRGTIVEAIVASFFINLLTVVMSFFSLQVYNQVIPSHSNDTLLVLMLGALLLIVWDLLMKLARSKIMARAIVGMDGSLSREIFQRLLRIRLDQMPGSVGSLAGQLRGYEQVRNFYTASTLFSVVDLPAALIFLFIIGIMATPWVAGVPLLVALVSLAVGMMFRHRVQRLATAGVRESNMKTGLLVETIEGAETIKASQGQWQFLSKWVEISSKAIQNDLKMRNTTDGFNYYLGSAQQLSYVLLVSIGAWFVVKGEMTMGALIASSILGGRVLAAVMQMPNLLVQHAHAKAAIDGIESLYTLKTDNDGVSRPLLPTRLAGNYSLQEVIFAYPDSPPALQIANLRIQAGERVGILGPIGSGKSTLLKVMTALYHPTEGRVFLDDLDVSHIAREAMSRQVGYLQQDHRLFQGTLRENLLVGMTDPGDDVLQQALQKTGLAQLVANHPRGLELPIFEGGKGLSGGQKQLVAFTRLVLSRPRIVLLDEPTASMDDALEQRCLRLLEGEDFADRTLVVVTHKPALLTLVSRLVVVAGGRVVMDGPKNEVLAHLQQPKKLSQQSSTPTPIPIRPEQVATSYAAGRILS